MAQAAHAADALRASISNGDLANSYIKWKNEADGFGTCLVFDGGSWNDIMEIRQAIMDVKACNDDVFMWKDVLDPTYPLRDGDVTHLIPINTCAIAFGDRELISPVVKDLGVKLYR